MTIYQPYTYLIGWSQYNKYYYGVRFAKDCHPNDLWNTYFTSSKYVKKFREENGDPDIIQIRKTFIKAKEAILWESKVLRRIKVVNNELWLNQTDYVKIDLYAWKLNNEKMRNVPLSEEHKRKISSTMKGMKPTIGMTGKKHKMKSKIKTSNTLKNNPKVKCPYCNKIGSISPMKRWHFKNCKLKPFN